MPTRIPPFTRVPAALAAGALAGCLAWPAAGDPAAEATGARRLNFDVYLDDREIGYHRFELRGGDGALRLTTEAEFEVRLLVFTAFEYEHRNTEVWRNGCLERIEARTNSNGERFAVAGEQRGAEFVLDTNGGSRRVQDCVGTFAYWDRSLLNRSRLLNSQTGEYVKVELEPLPRGTLRLGGADLAIDRVALKAPGMDIELAYVADSGEWVALDSTVRGGRRLRYRRSPADFTGPAGLALAGGTDTVAVLR